MKRADDGTVIWADFELCGPAPRRRIVIRVIEVECVVEQEEIGHGPWCLVCTGTEQYGVAMSIDDVAVELGVV